MPDVRINGARRQLRRACTVTDTSSRRELFVKHSDGRYTTRPFTVNPGFTCYKAAVVELQ